MMPSKKHTAALSENLGHYKKKWSGMFSLYFSLLGLLFSVASCKHEHNIRRIEATSPSEAYENFVNNPSVENFDLVCELGENRDNVQCKILYYFSVYWDAQVPVYPSIVSEVDINAAETYLKNHAPAFYEPLVVVITKSDFGMGRWVAATILARFGDKRCLPALEKCLETEMDFDVAAEIRIAIKQIQKRQFDEKM